MCEEPVLYIQASILVVYLRVCYPCRRVRICVLFNYLKVYVTCFYFTLDAVRVEVLWPTRNIQYARALPICIIDSKIVSECNRLDRRSC